MEADWKKVLAEVLKRLGLIPENWTGEITIGMTNGGVTFVRKSETIK